MQVSGAVLQPQGVGRFVGLSPGGGSLFGPGPPPGTLQPSRQPDCHPHAGVLLSDSDLVSTALRRARARHCGRACSSPQQYLHPITTASRWYTMRHTCRLR